MNHRGSRDTSFDTPHTHIHNDYTVFSALQGNTNKQLVRQTETQ